MRIKRFFSVILVLAFMLTINGLFFGFSLPKVSASESVGTEVFKDEFNYTMFEGESLYDSNIWSNETNKARPVIQNGVVKSSKGYSLQFNYQNISGFVFNKNKTYTISFDTKITSFGDDGEGTTRELYVAPGGWFNQLELKSNATNPIRTGDTWTGKLDVEYKTNVTYTVVIVWEPSLNKITTTLKNGENVISTGFRTNTSYGSNLDYMAYWVFRCEDGANEIDNFKFTDGTINYEQKFEYEAPEASMTYSGLWKTESLEKPGTAPMLSNGVLKFDTHDSVEFLWNEVVEYSESKIYTFDFDLKVTNLGNGSNWGADTQTRVLYVAPGGYYNQLQLYTKDSKIIAGETSIGFDSSRHFNKNLHVRLVIEGDTITTTLYDEFDNVLVTGFRSNSAYTNMTDRNKTMARMVLRCEDGAFEIDNFTLSEKAVTLTDVYEMEIPTNQSATFTCDLLYSESDEISLKLNGNNIISLSNDGMKVCSGFVGGSYSYGTYKIKIYINPLLEMVNVEIVLPDGGVVRRGTYSYVTAKPIYKVELRSYSSDVISNTNCIFNDEVKNEYEIVSEEPYYEGVNEYIYNIITSFIDPYTSRSFAWTTLEHYLTNIEMQVRYREVGTTEWLYEDAMLEDEAINNDEDYYKADIYNLKPDTTYEYSIGAKDSTDEENEWTKIYTFKTASLDEDEFTFIAVGDTQGITWNGKAVSNKGFMYAKAAYDEAFEEVENPAFILHGGDVVENGNNVNQWNYFFKSIGDTVTSVPHFATIGNHDVVSKGADPRFYFNLHFNHPNNGGIDAIDPEYANRIGNRELRLLAQQANETVYSFDYGDAHFIVLNSGNYSNEDYYILEAQREWLELDLKYNACSKWTVVLFHEPVYHRLGGAESRPWLGKLMEEYNVDLVIQGHSHLVTRTYPMKNGEIVTKVNPDVITQGTGTVYTTIGSTALNHDSMGSINVEECMLIATPNQTQSAYTTITISDDKIVMTVKQINGLILDRFEIVANEELHKHHGEEQIVGVKEASCLEDGYTGDKVCSYCQDILEKGSVVPAVGHHDFGDWQVTKEPTTKTEGEQTRTCKECGLVETETLPPLKKGCFGSIGFSVIGITILTGSMIVLKKKKEE